MTVQQMIDMLEKMPKDAILKIECSGYLFDMEDDFYSVKDPILNENGTVTIGKVCA